MKTLSVFAASFQIPSPASREFPLHLQGEPLVRSIPPSPLGKVSSPSHARRRRMRSCSAQMCMSGKWSRAKWGTSFVSRLAGDRRLPPSPKGKARTGNSAAIYESSKPITSNPLTRFAGAPLASSRGALNGASLTSPASIFSAGGSARRPCAGTCPTCQSCDHTPRQARIQARRPSRAGPRRRPRRARG